ncbi:MAG: hypothetical protein IT262_08185 [Saprospiraceae bacterium]|nr:hypothetical protein [Saprospiraceae bacterium]
MLFGEIVECFMRVKVSAAVYFVILSEPFHFVGHSTVYATFVILTGSVRSTKRNRVKMRT